jgi:hypothetical protein
LLAALVVLVVFRPVGRSRLLPLSWPFAVGERPVFFT